MFRQELWRVILRCGGAHGLLTFLAAGARWRRQFAQEPLRGLARGEFLLDWYHRVKKVKDRISRMGGSKEVKQALRRAVLPALGQGQVETALPLLAPARATAPNPKALAERTEYLEVRQAELPDYRARRAQRQSIGSGQAEKANDLLVARRQKNRGMHWNIVTSEALARLKRRQLNHEWDAYWLKDRLPSLVAA